MADKIIQGSLNVTGEIQQNGKAVLSNLADVYSSSSTYAVNDYVIYDNALYKCTTAITVAEAWDSTH